MQTQTIPLPRMDAQIPGLEPGGTRANIIRDYRESDNALVTRVLREARLFLNRDQILAAGAKRVIMPPLGPLEFAAVVYFDCLTDESLIRQEFNMDYVVKCIESAREYYVSIPKSYLE